jgi:hypothetical protein
MQSNLTIYETHSGVLSFLKNPILNEHQNYILEHSEKDGNKLYIHEYNHVRNKIIHTIKVEEDDNIKNAVAYMRNNLSLSLFNSDEWKTSNFVVLLSNSEYAEMISDESQVGGSKKRRSKTSKRGRKGKRKTSRKSSSVKH